MASPNTADSPLDPVMGVLIAQLFDNGQLDGEDIANMTRRLHESGLPGLANAIRMLALACAIDTPENRRAAIHVLPDGGNDRD